ncbi:MAG: TIGR02452 family protein [Myxococcota bacterium]
MKAVADETQAIVREGGYHVDGHNVSIAAEVQQAVAGTVGLSPREAAQEFERVAFREAQKDGAAALEVTGETTQQAAHRLRDSGPLAILNFASATKPGGGFLNGARAQEEDLARCSGLFACLKGADVPGGFYALHRQRRDLLYTDAMIYSPRVPFFRREASELLREPYFPSVLTVAAPYARKSKASAADIEVAYRRRAGALLAVLAGRGYRTLVLGAWGCGVFGCDPTMAASAFRRWLRGTFRGSFDRVVFPVYDPAPGQPLRAVFERELTAS